MTKTEWLIEAEKFCACVDKEDCDLDCDSCPFQNSLNKCKLVEEAYKIINADVFSVKQKEVEEDTYCESCKIDYIDDGK